MFGTSGIRGLYGKEVTPELARKVGNALGKAGGKIIVARDTRSTSPILSESLASGAMLSGAAVIDIGIAPTPLLAYTTMKENCDGAMITASHNPPEYNGIKLFSSGMEFTKQREKEVESAVSGNERAAEWKSAGQKTEKDCSKEYIAFLLSKADAAAIRAKKPRVLVDAGNAAAYSLAPALLSAAGCEVVQLNCDTPGKFVRNLEPNPSTLSETAKAVKKNKCDFGLAFDGDGDRCLAIDEKGKVLPLDVQLSLFCSHMLQKGLRPPDQIVQRDKWSTGRIADQSEPQKSSGSGWAGGNNKIVSTVEASLCVRDTVRALKSKIFITPVGSLYVAHEVKKQGAIFGGEPCGEYIFPSATPCAEGLLTALFIAEIFSQKGPLSALSEAVKTYPMERRKYKCNEGKKQLIMQKIMDKPALEGHLSKVDGLRYDFEDGWLLIRPSGTEPAIRLTCEAKTPKKLDEIIQRADTLIMQAMDAAG